MNSFTFCPRNWLRLDYCCHCRYRCHWSYSSSNLYFDCCGYCCYFSRNTFSNNCDDLQSGRSIEVYNSTYQQFDTKKNVNKRQTMIAKLREMAPKIHALLHTFTTSTSLKTPIIFQTPRKLIPDDCLFLTTHNLFFFSLSVQFAPIINNQRKRNDFYLIMFWKVSSVYFMCISSMKKKKSGSRRKQLKKKTLSDRVLSPWISSILLCFPYSLSLSDEKSTAKKNRIFYQCVYDAGFRSFWTMVPCWMFSILLLRFNFLASNVPNMRHYVSHNALYTHLYVYIFNFKWL